MRRLGNIKKGKKPKTEEEEAAELEEHKNKVAECLSKNLIATRIDRSEHKIQLLTTEFLMENHLKMDYDMFEKLNRKVSVLDIDIGE